MTTEQNEPQAQSAPQGQTQAQGQNGAGNQGHRRRRRRRNKGAGKPQGATASQPNGTSGQGNGSPAQNAPGRETGQPFQSAPPPPSQKSKPQKRFFPKSNGHGGGGNGFHSNGNGAGNGNGNGGGQRRKGKQRRQQVFVGPMDHSYRMSNGNVAEAGGNGQQQEFRGMPHSGFYPENDFYSAPTPAPVREDAPTRIFCFIEDLFVLAKIQEVSKKLGIKVGYLKAEKETLAMLTGSDEEHRPSLIIIDLNNASAKPLTLIPKIRAKLKRGTSIIGFLSHLQGDLKVKASEAGCDMVMPRSAFSQNLPNLLRRHGLEEEEEMDMMPA